MSIVIGTKFHMKLYHIYISANFRAFVINIF